MRRLSAFTVGLFSKCLTGIFESEQARSQDLDTHGTHMHNGRLVCHPILHIDGRRQIDGSGVIRSAEGD